MACAERGSDTGRQAQPAVNPLPRHEPPGDGGTRRRPEDPQRHPRVPGRSADHGRNRAPERDRGSSRHGSRPMTRSTTLAVALTAILASGTAGLAQPPAQPTQQPPAAPSSPPPPPGTPPPPPPPRGATSSDAGVDLSVEVTISRYRGNDLVSSLPYVLALTTDRDGQGSLHMDAEIPVMNRPMPANPAIAADPDPARFLPPMSYQYRSVGTQIESFARSAGDGRSVAAARRIRRDRDRRPHAGGHAAHL